MESYSGMPNRARMLPTLVDLALPYHHLFLATPHQVSLRDLPAGDLQIAAYHSHLARIPLSKEGMTALAAAPS